MSVNTVQANGTYTAGKKLTFNLNFADTVSVITPANVSITLNNRGTQDSHTEKTITLTSTAQANVTTLVFDWPSIDSGLEMRQGVYISKITITGLQDKYGISLLPTTTITGSYTGNFSGHASVNNCANLSSGVIVDALNPTIDTSIILDKGRTPMHNTNPTNGKNDLITSITLTFNEPVMKGNGIITIRPRVDYAIPPVLEGEGYYLGYTSNGQPTGGANEIETGVPTKFTSSGAKRTYISSFYDIYNAIPSTPATPGKSQSDLRNYLTKGTSMSNLDTSPRTGLSLGPYKLMTQGLISGFGHTGDYSGTNTTGTNAPSPSSGFMIPDTASKWVLDYQYPIIVPTGNSTVLDAQRLAVGNIRTALTNAKWRWQEIDVVSASVSGSTVTIPLNEPLLKGLEWEVYYPAGAFTDLAGNPAAKSGTTTADPTAWTNTDYYFISPGVQAPVIRVNRRSSDSRNSNWGGKITFDDLDTGTDTSGWGSNTTVVTDTSNNKDDDKGWRADNFRYVHYRVESESSVISSVVVSAQVFKGTSGGRNSITGAFSTNSIRTGNYNPPTTPAYPDRTWNQGASNTATEWVLPNLVRRAATATQTYTVTTKYGVQEARSSNTDNNPVRIYKSYNKDLTAAELGLLPSGAGPTITTSTPASLSPNADTKGQAIIDFTNYEANKSYIVGTTSWNGVTAKGAEGIFRTVVMFNYENSRRTRFIAVEGSNIKNGMPSVAGFPVRDADEYDCRFFKVFFNPTADQGTTPRTNFYWVSTEIVCEWYLISWGGGSTNTLNGTHQNCGEVNNYLMVGYGDLTYGYNISRWYDGNL